MDSEAAFPVPPPNALSGDWTTAILHSLPVMIIATDSTGVIRQANPSALYHLGYAEHELLNRATILLLHDLGQVQQRAVQLSSELGRPIRPGLEALTAKANIRGSDTLECDYIRKDGSAFPAIVQISPLQTTDNAPLGFLYSVREREVKSSSPTETVESAESGFRDFLDNTHDLVQSITPEGHYLYVNRAWLRALEYHVDDLPQLTLVDIIHPVSMGQTAILFKQALSGHRHSRQELVLMTRNGQEIIVESTNSFSYEKGRLTAIRSIFHDITTRKHQEQMLAEHQRQLSNANVKLALLATTDALTGLKNRRVFDERLDYECERAIRQKNPLSLMILDVDHFKMYNDKFGHPAGDHILQQLSMLLLQNSRSIDCVVRYGGEEFAIILPNTDATGAGILAERMRRVIMNNAWPERMITVSIGVASIMPQSTDAIRQLIEEADHQLYAAKDAGRNRISPAPAASYETTTDESD